MTTMKAKEYLSQYRKSLETAAKIEAHLDELKAEAYKLKDHEGQKVELDEAVARYMDACSIEAAELNRLSGVRIEVQQLIDKVADDKLHALLREIYIYGKRLVRIAADRDQSYEHICRLHGDALNAIRSIRPDLE